MCLNSRELKPPTVISSDRLQIYTKIDIYAITKIITKTQSTECMCTKAQKYTVDIKQR